MGNRLGKEQEGGSLLDPEELLQECREHLIQLFTLWCQQTFQTRLRQIQLEQEMERLDSIRAELEGLRVYLAVFQDPTLEDQEDWDMETKVQEWMEQAEDDLHNLRVNLLEPQQEDRPPNPQGSLRDSRESSPEDNRDPSLRDSLLERLLDSQEDLREDSLPFSQQDQEEVPDSLPTQWEESLLDSQVEYSPTNHQGAPQGTLEEEDLHLHLVEDSQVSPEGDNLEEDHQAHQVVEPLVEDPQDLQEVEHPVGDHQETEVNQETVKEDQTPTSQTSQT